MAARFKPPCISDRAVLWLMPQTPDLFYASTSLRERPEVQAILKPTMVSLQEYVQREREVRFHERPGQRWGVDGGDGKKAAAAGKAVGAITEHILAGIDSKLDLAQLYLRAALEAPFPLENGGPAMMTVVRCAMVGIGQTRGETKLLVGRRAR